MFRTSVAVDQDADGRPLAVPDEFRKGVERASLLLATDLLPTAAFEIDADWRFVRGQDGRVGVALDLSTPYEKRRVGVTGYPLDAEDFADDLVIRRSLNDLVWNFNRTLSHINSIDTRHLRQRLERNAELAGV